MKLLRITVLLSLIAIAFSTATQAAAAANVERISLQGQTAVANFDSINGCIETVVLVAGSQFGTGQSGDVVILQNDNCTATLLLAATGSTPNPTFQVASDLTSASLSATIPVSDRVSGNTFNVSVNTTWTGTGQAVRQNGSFITHFGNIISDSHFNGASRDASASSTVTDGTTNFTPSPSVSAQIASLKSGAVSISTP